MNEERSEVEYGLMAPGETNTKGLSRGAHFISKNRAHIEKLHKRGHPSIQFVERTVAGPWTPVCESLETKGGHNE